MPCLSAARGIPVCPYMLHLQYLIVSYLLYAEMLMSCVVICWGVRQVEVGSVARQ